MGSIHYDPEQILKGFTEDNLKVLAKRLKRRIRVIKSDIIQDILCPPKGKPEDRVKVWQEINRHLRKELEAFSEEEFKISSLNETPLEELFKVSYMFTLSSNPATKAMGEELYSQAEDNKELEKSRGYDEDEEASAALSVITAEVEDREVRKTTEHRDRRKPIEAKAVIEPIVKEVKLIKEHGIVDTQDAKRVKDHPERVNRVSIAKVPSTDEVPAAEPKELQKRIRILEKKLKTSKFEGLRTKGQLDKLKSDWVALRVQWFREKEETEKYRNRVRELESERKSKDKEIEMLKKKLEQSQYNNSANSRVKHSGEIDLAAYHGRKALIFAEHDNDVDIRLNALGIIPIWAMEIDWNRPRRRMSTCQIVLYKMNNEKLKKLDEIRNIARYLNIPCNELIDV